MSKEKIYRLKKTRSGMSSTYETVYEGTLDHLINGVFGYTLQCGSSWNRKINRNPKTIRALVTAINKSYEETEGGYTRSYVKLID